MDDNEMQAALEILRSGTIAGEEILVTDEQRCALQAAIDDYNEWSASLAHRPITPPTTSVFTVRG